MKPQSDQDAANLDHPCKQTCSGWKQGYERGVEFERAQAAELAKVLEHHSECWGKECTCGTWDDVPETCLRCLTDEALEKHRARVGGE